MNDTLRESLSALMDNEADELELRRILKKIPRDKELQASWQRYHLLSATLRQESHTRPSVNLLDGIHAALENDPLPVRTGSSRRGLAGGFQGIAGYLGQSAIAASVALAVLFTAESLTDAQQGSLNTPMADASSAQPIRANTTGDYQPGELARTASFSGGPSTLDPETSNRIREAVYRELERGSPPYPIYQQGYENLEIPVNYTPGGGN